MVYDSWGQCGQAVSYYMQAREIFNLLGMTAQEEGISEAMDSLPNWQQ